MIYEVIPNGPACHTGETSCFHETLAGERTASASDMITELSALIKQRESDLPEGAYTTYLFEEGSIRSARKSGRSSRSHHCCKNRDARELATESADLLYHLLVLLQEQKVDFKEVTGVLEERHAAKRTSK
ncbi:phosphoribosyl-ATP diphosphatase [Planococcus sp. MB-3u-03]|uniref:phosphoribosyl-ATP diphosphatase n=1 Tax=Planococcus sp. MB-3u-03 TaxID=2058136 RepID=UPI003FA78B5F